MRTAGGLRERSRGGEKGSRLECQLARLPPLAGSRRCAEERVPESRDWSQSRGARDTHQLQRAEADERAATGAAAHGAGGVPAATDPRFLTPLLPDSGAARPGTPGPAAAARRSRAPGLGLAPAFVRLPAGRAEVSAARAARASGGGPCLPLCRSACWGGGAGGRAGGRAGQGTEGGYRW
jgi:hypothetical protein